MIAQHRHCPLIEQLAVFVELNPAAAAFDQLHSELGLKIGKVDAQRRLGDMQPLCRLHQAARLGDTDKIAKVLDIHDRFTSTPALAPCRAGRFCLDQSNPARPTSPALSP